MQSLTGQHLDHCRRHRVKKEDESDILKAEEQALRKPRKA
jgi:hypothetical protein